MTLTELEHLAVQELAEELRQRIELEHGGLESTQFKLTKLQIRVKLFGKQDLTDEERELLTEVYPEDIAKHTGDIARMRTQLDRLLAYSDS